MSALTTATGSAAGTTIKVKVLAMSTYGNSTLSDETTQTNVDLETVPTAVITNLAAADADTSSSSIKFTWDDLSASLTAATKGYTDNVYLRLTFGDYSGGSSISTDTGTGYQQLTGIAASTTEYTFTTNI
jgi:hypothetical protein